MSVSAPPGPDVSFARLPIATPIVACVGLYGLSSAGIYLAAVGNPALLSVSLALLTAQVILFVLAGIFAPRVADQRFYLAASILPTFMFARLLLQGSVPGYGEVLLSYLLLAATLVVFVSTTGAGVQVPGSRSIRAGWLLGAGLPIGLGLSVLEAGVPSEIARRGISVVFVCLIAGIAAFLDEFWFRGLLQTQAEAVSDPRIGWLTTATLFAATAAPTGDPWTLAYRAGTGLILGYIVMRFRVLPLALTIRTVAAIAAALLVGIVPSPIPRA